MAEGLSPGGPAQGEAPPSETGRIISEFLSLLGESTLHSGDDKRQLPKLLKAIPLACAEIALRVSDPYRRRVKLLEDNIMKQTEDISGPFQQRIETLEEELEKARSENAALRTTFKEATARVDKSLNNIKTQRDDALAEVASLKRQLEASAQSKLTPPDPSPSEPTPPDPATQRKKASRHYASYLAGEHFRISLDRRAKEALEQARLTREDASKPPLVAIWPEGTGEARRINRLDGVGVFLASQPTNGLFDHLVNQTSPKSRIPCWWSDQPDVVYDTRCKAIERFAKVSNANAMLGVFDFDNNFHTLQSFKDVLNGLQPKLALKDSVDWIESVLSGTAFALDCPPGPTEQVVPTDDESDSTDILVVDTDESDSELTIIDGMPFIARSAPGKRASPEPEDPRPLKKAREQAGRPKPDTV